MSTVIKAKINKLLDKAEDPSETLEYSYAKQMELLQNVKKGIADVVTAKKRLQLQAAEARAAGRQARHAGAPGARRRATRTSPAPRSSASSSPRPSCSRSTSRSPSSRPAAAGLIDKEQKLRAKLEQFRTKKEVIKAQYSAAEAAGARSPRPRPASARRWPTSAWRCSARRTRRRTCAPARARWRSSRPPARSTTTSRSAAGQDDIDRQLAELTSGSQVDDELARMKAELGQGAAPAPALEERQPGRPAGPGAASRDRPDRDGGPVPAARRGRASASTSSTTRRSRRSRPATRPRFHAALRRDARARAHATGTKLGDDELEESDVILPPPDLSFAEAAARVHRRRPDPGLTAAQSVTARLRARPPAASISTTLDAPRAAPGFAGRRPTARRRPGRARGGSSARSGARCTPSRAEAAARAACCSAPGACDTSGKGAHGRPTCWARWPPPA